MPFLELFQSVKMGFENVFRQRRRPGDAILIMKEVENGDGTRRFVNVGPSMNMQIMPTFSPSQPQRRPWASKLPPEMRQSREEELRRFRRENPSTRVKADDEDQEVDVVNDDDEELENILEEMKQDVLVNQAVVSQEKEVRHVPSKTKEPGDDSREIEQFFIEESSTDSDDLETGRNDTETEPEPSLQEENLDFSESESEHIAVRSRRGCSSSKNKKPPQEENTDSSESESEESLDDSQTTTGQRALKRQKTETVPEVVQLEDIQAHMWTAAPAKIRKIGRSEIREENYNIERIVDIRFRSNTRQFLVKWERWAEEFNSWEPEDNFDDPATIEKFMEERNNRILASLGRV